MSTEPALSVQSESVQRLVSSKSFGRAFQGALAVNLTKQYYLACRCSYLSRCQHAAFARSACLAA